MDSYPDLNAVPFSLISGPDPVLAASPYLNRIQIQIQTLTLTLILARIWTRILDHDFDFDHCLDLDMDADWTSTRIWTWTRTPTQCMTDKKQQINSKFIVDTGHTADHHLTSTVRLRSSTCT